MIQLTQSYKKKIFVCHITKTQQILGHLSPSVYKVLDFVFSPKLHNNLSCDDWCFYKLLFKIWSVERHVLDGLKSRPADPQSEPTNGDQVLDQAEKQRVDAVPQDCR